MDNFQEVFYLNKEVRSYRLPLITSLSKCYKNFKLITTDSTSQAVMKEINKYKINTIIVKKITLREKEAFNSKWPNIYFSFGLLSEIRKRKDFTIIIEGVAGLFISLLPLFYKKFKLICSYERTVHTERNASFLKLMYFKIINYIFTPNFVVNGEATKILLKKRNIESKRIFSPNLSLSYEFEQLKNEEVVKEIESKSIEVNSNRKILWVSQLIDRKNFNALIDLMNSIKNLNNIHLDIFGDGVYKDKLVSHSQDYKNITYHGLIPNSELINFYKKSHFLFLPTLEDNWSVVALEASRCGCLVLTSPENGIQEDFKKFNANRVDTPENHIKYLLEDKEIISYAKLCKDSLNFSSNFKHSDVFNAFKKSISK